MVLVIVVVAVLLVVGLTVLVVVTAGYGPALSYASERHSTNKQGVGANVC